MKKYQSLIILLDLYIMNKLQDITNNTKTLFIELGLSSYDEYIWYHFPRVWKYI